MVRFKDWEEMRWFLDTHCNFSCLNCTYGSNKKDKLDNSPYVFCMRTIAMVNLGMMTVCAEWKSDKGKTVEDYGDCPIFKLPDETLEKLENGELSVEDLRNE